MNGKSTEKPFLTRNNGGRAEKCGRRWDLGSGWVAKGIRPLNQLVIWVLNTRDYRVASRRVQVGVTVQNCKVHH